MPKMFEAAAGTLDEPDCIGHRPGRSRTFLSAFLPGIPSPASRPRVTRNGTYYSKPYKEWKKGAVELLEEIRWLHKMSRHDGLFELHLAVYKPVPKKTDRDIPPGDVDNYAKAVMDALKTAQLVRDDDDCQGLEVWKFYRDPPGISVVVNRLDFPAAAPSQR